MAIQSSTNLYQTFKFVVSNIAGESPFSTIQAAINAAQAAGANTTVYVRPGTYTENLTLYNAVDVEGTDSTLVTIVGTHLPPVAGAITFNRIRLSSTTHIFSSAAAGSCTIRITNCTFTVTNGYACNLANWTGPILIKNCNEISSTHDGVIYNTGASLVEIFNCSVGYGTAQTMSVNGVVNLFGTSLSCPVSLSGSATSNFDGGCSFNSPLTISGSANLSIINSSISTGSAVSLTVTSLNPVVLTNVSINTTNAVAIAGTGSVNFDTVSFTNSKVIAGTITEILTGTLKTGESVANNIQRTESSGFYSWAASGPYFDDTTLGSFTLLIGGTGYIMGKSVVWTGPQTVTGLTAGNTYFIYIDSTGTLQKTTARTEPLFVNNIVLFECLRDSSAVNNQLTVKENHPYNFSQSVSNYTHDVIGIVIENSNNGANIVIVGTQGIGISGADVLSDHGLDTTIPDSSGLGVTWYKYYTNASGKWARQNATTTFTGYYNNGGTVTALPANKYGVYRLYTSKDSLNSSTPIYVAVLHTAFFNTIGLAQTAITGGTIVGASNELAYLELAQLGYIVYEQSSSTIVQVTISKATLRSTTSSAGATTANLILANTTNFNNVLSSSDTTVQTALETLDDFGSGTGVQAVNLFTGAAVKTVVFGSTNTTSATTIQAGSTGLSLSTAVANGPINISSGTGTINIAASATGSTLNLGTGAGAKSVNVGSTNTTSSLALSYGTSDFTLASATGTVMSALDTGEITYPLQPSFLVRAETQSNVTGDGTNYKILFNTETFDRNSDFDLVNSRFVAPVSGIYQFNVMCRLEGITSSHVYGYLNIESGSRNYEYEFNPAAIRILNPPTYDRCTISFSTLIDINSSYFVEVDVYISGGTKTVSILGTIDAYSWFTYFSGYLVA
jgi:hypothetical protein